MCNKLSVKKNVIHMFLIWGNFYQTLTAEYSITTLLYGPYPNSKFTCLGSFPRCQTASLSSIKFSPFFFFFENKPNTNEDSYVTKNIQTDTEATA